MTALSPLARSRQATPSAIPSSVRSITSRFAVSTSKVCSWPIDFAGSPVATGSGSRPTARSTSEAPCLPKRRTRASGGRAARSPMVTTPKSRKRLGRLPAHAPQARDRERREERRLAARRHDDQAVGLPEVGRDLGDQLRRGHAHRGRQADLLVDRGLDRAPDRLAVAEQRPRPGHVEERLVDRDRLHLGREPAQDRHDLAADLLVLAPVDRQEHALRAQAARRPQRHRRVDAELAGLVRRRGHDAALVRPAAADDHRPAAQLRPVALLDRREERVEVDVEDRALAHARDSRPVRPGNLPGGRAKLSG